MSERESSGITVREASRFARSAVPGPRGARCLVRWIFALATLAALVFALAGPSRAQSQSTASKSAPVSTATPTKVAVVDTATVTQAATDKPPAEMAAPAGQSASKGQQEGIKIHGHWTIDVKNPDGTVVTHREFENGINPNFGALLLAGVLNRVATPGSWAIRLNDATVNSIEIDEPSSTASADCTSALKTLQTGYALTCSNNLSIAGPQFISGNLTQPKTLTFTGSGSVPQGFSSTIASVQTIFFVCATSESPVTCSTDPLAVQVGFTSRQLDGLNGDPIAVPVSVGQTVAVMVTISFQ